MKMLLPDNVNRPFLNDPEQSGIGTGAFVGVGLGFGVGVGVGAEVGGGEGAGVGVDDSTAGPAWDGSF